jgi:hypothetical protein
MGNGVARVAKVGLEIRATDLTSFSASMNLVVIGPDHDGLRCGSPWSVISGCVVRTVDARHCSGVFLCLGGFVDASIGYVAWNVCHGLLLVRESTIELLRQRVEDLIVGDKCSVAPSM